MQGFLVRVGWYACLRQCTIGILLRSCGLNDRRMSKKKRSKLPAEAFSPTDAPQEAVPADFSMTWRIVASIFIVIHLLVVTAEPLRFFSMSSRGNSPATDPARNTLAPLIEFGYLNHGYFFFAPEPGPSHLLDFRFDAAEGPVRIRFPDRRAQWPRLLYHRHFMLTENLNQLWVPPVDPTLSPSDPLATSWRSDRRRYEIIRDSMNSHVAAKYGAVSPVEVDRIEHVLPSLFEVVEDGIELQDPRLYVTLPDGLEDDVSRDAVPVEPANVLAPAEPAGEPVAPPKEEPVP